MAASNGKLPLVNVDVGGSIEIGDVSTSARAGSLWRDLK